MKGKERRGIEGKEGDKYRGMEEEGKERKGMEGKRRKGEGREKKEKVGWRG